MIEDILERLQETWSLTTEELKDIRQEMAVYALSATVDSAIREEALAICDECDTE